MLERHRWSDRRQPALVLIAVVWLKSAAVAGRPFTCVKVQKIFIEAVYDFFLVPFCLASAVHHCFQSQPVHISHYPLKVNHFEFSSVVIVIFLSVDAIVLSNVINVREDGAFSFALISADVSSVAADHPEF